MAETMRVDAVVVGAGTAGANAAYQLADRGLAVAMVDRRPADLGGAQWHNGVLPWQFERAGLAPPKEPELHSAHATTHLVGPDGTRAATLVDSPTVRADMARLGARLRHLACEAGVSVVDEARRIDVELSGDRMVALDVDVEPAAGSARSVRFEAPLFVDASGRGGALRRRSPVLSRWCPPVPTSECCAAGDYDLRVGDRDGALAFLERHGAQPGEAVTQVGVHGGWSTRAITVSEDLEEVGLLVGCIADDRHPGVPAMLDAARTAEPWLGDTISGGTGIIPLRRAYARLTAPGVALVGDSGSQVFPVHGSGIGLGLMAGRLLADAVAGTGDPGSTATLWRYQADFHHEFGADLISFDATRRMSTALGSDGVGEMIHAGLLAEPMTRSGLDQRWTPPPPALLVASAARLARRPRLAATILPRLARGQVAGVLASRYPREVDEPALARWDRRVGSVLGALPQPGPSPARR